MKELDIEKAKLGIGKSTLSQECVTGKLALPDMDMAAQERL